MIHRWEVQLSDSTTMQVTRKNITGILQECVKTNQPTQTNNNTIDNMYKQTNASNNNYV